MLDIIHDLLNKYNKIKGNIIFLKFSIFCKKNYCNGR